MAWPRFAKELVLDSAVASVLDSEDTELSEEKFLPMGFKCQVLQRHQ